MALRRAIIRFLHVEQMNIPLYFPQVLFKSFVLLILLAKIYKYSMSGLSVEMSLDINVDNEK